MANFPTSFKELCAPAAFYFVVSMIALLVVCVQNIRNRNSYVIGNLSCRVPSTIIVLIFNFIYILFWTYVVNLICKDGHKTLSWILVLLPWIALFILIGMIMLNV